MKAIALILGSLLFAVPATATTPKKVSGKIYVEQTGTLKTIQWLYRGTTHSIDIYTNYVTHPDVQGNTEHFTIECDERFRWNHCYELQKGSIFDAVLEEKNKTNFQIVITGHLNGNLMPIVHFKSRVVVLPSNLDSQGLVF